MKKAQEEQNINADTPVSDKSHDSFQRYPFAKRIAQTITLRNENEPLVIGIYGEWGEGKTSVLHFIEREITNLDPKIIQIRFNPWMFPDEPTLIKNFFNLLASEIYFKGKDSAEVKKSNSGKLNNKPSKNPLNTKSEKLGKFLFDYGKHLAPLGYGIDDAAQVVGRILKKDDLETLKKRIEELLTKIGMRIVIFIDDIDRLEKSEISAIFRLVKLTGNFPYLTYILAFDQKVVAEALGERFGPSGTKAGESFLEKVIQLPLSLPKAEPESLKYFCFSKLEKILNINNISLSDEDARNFGYKFTKYILAHASTPREIVRYCNSVSFTLPVLKDEINILDLLYMEAIKVFHPSYFNFLKSNPSYFIKSYKSEFGREDDESKKNEIKKQFNLLGQGKTEFENSNLKSIISLLFPHLDRAIYNSFSDTDEDNWYSEKRIASKDYFYKYFSYAPIKGDVSDVAFQNLFEKVENNESLENITLLIQDILENSSSEKFSYKLLVRSKKLDWSQAKLLMPALANCSDLFSTEGGFLSYRSTTPFGQIARFICQSLIEHKSQLDNFDFTKSLLKNSAQFSFAYEVFRFFYNFKDDEMPLFSDFQLKELEDLIVIKAINEAGDRALIDTFPSEFYFIANVLKERFKHEYDQHVMNYLELNSHNAVNVIKHFTPTVTVNDGPQKFKGDLKFQNFKDLISIFDKDVLFNKLSSLYNIDELLLTEPKWQSYRNSEFTEENLIRQFLYWYYYKETQSDKDQEI